MPQQIGRHGHGQGRGDRDDPIAQLLRCHDRLREFAALAGRLAPGEDASDAELVEAAEDVRRYFTVASPRHTADEDETITPVLLEARAPADVLDALARMTREHGPIEQAVA